MKVTWRLWRSDAGDYYASRQGWLTGAQLTGGLAMTLSADDPDTLQQLINAQAVLQRKLDG